jgi:hypothetical protein
MPGPQVLPWLDAGDAVDAVADYLCVRRQTVYDWVERSQGRGGLDVRARPRDVLRPGRPRTGGGAVDPSVAAVIDSDPRDLGDHSTRRAGLAPAGDPSLFTAYCYWKDTLSKVAVLALPGLRLVTASPVRTPLAIETVKLPSEV